MVYVSTRTDADAANAGAENRFIPKGITRTHGVLYRDAQLVQHV